MHGAIHLLCVKHLQSLCLDLHFRKNQVLQRHLCARCPLSLCALFIMETLNRGRRLSQADQPVPGGAFMAGEFRKILQIVMHVPDFHVSLFSQPICQVLCKKLFPGSVNRGMRSILLILQVFMWDTCCHSCINDLFSVSRKGLVKGSKKYRGWDRPLINLMNAGRPPSKHFGVELELQSLRELNLRWNPPCTWWSTRSELAIVWVLIANFTIKWPLNQKWEIMFLFSGLSLAYSYKTTGAVLLGQAICHFQRKANISLASKKRDCL